MSVMTAPESGYAKLKGHRFVESNPSRFAPEAMEQTLKQRAARLAEIPIEEQDGQLTDLLLLRLDREVYGLDAQYVERIEPADTNPITLVPRVPDWVAGIVNLRGRILSAIDLQRFLGLPVTEQDPDKESLVIVHTPEVALALLVDGVMNVETVADSQVHGSLSTVRGLHPEYVQGVAERHVPETEHNSGSDSMVVILDLPAILADKSLIVYEEVL